MLPALVGAAQGETVERILAVVDGRPLLLSEVDVVASLKGLDQKAALEAEIAQTELRLRLLLSDCVAVVNEEHNLDDGHRAVPASHT